MSCNFIFYKDGAKMMRPVHSREEFLALRNSESNRKAEKRNMVQFNYSCLPNEDGTLKGSKRLSKSVGMDVDLPDDVATDNEKLKQIEEYILAKKDELGLLMLEKSATKGFHLVFRRHLEMTQEDNLRWASELIGVLFDEGAKDITRVFFTPADKLIYLSDELFDNSSPSTVNGQQSTEASQSTVNSQQSTDFPLAYEGVPYAAIVESLCTLLGGTPSHGSRNTHIFAMACYLRYICDDDAEWIAQILPTYGEDTEKWRRTIESACQRAQSREMPHIMRKAIEMARGQHSVKESSDQPPEMPRRLPMLIRHLIKNVPEVCKAAVANAVFPALATHLHGVKFWLLDGTEKEATFMNVLVAKQSVGKSSVNKPIEYIMADITATDEISRQKEKEWKEAMATKGANKEKPPRPEISIQNLMSDCTNAALVLRTAEAKGKYLFTNFEELDLLKQLQVNGMKDVGKIICLCFDNGRFGAERVGTASVSEVVNLRWNWNASTTIQQGQKFFRNMLVNGVLSRLSFCTIVPDEKPFVFGRYDEEYAEALKPYIANLTLCKGYVECTEALKMAKSMLDKCLERSALTGDEVLRDLSYRAVTIAYLKAMVLFICNSMTWSKEIEHFAEWSLEYDLWCKMHFFGAMARDAMKGENSNNQQPQKNLLSLLNDEFSLEEFQQVRRQQGLDASRSASLHHLQTWLYRKFVERCQDGRYRKTDSYLKRYAA